MATAKKKILTKVDTTILDGEHIESSGGPGATCATCGITIKETGYAYEGRIYCSKACYEASIPVCETCLSPLTDPIENEAGFTFCCERCRNIDALCASNAQSIRSRPHKIAGMAGVLEGARKTSELYADQVLFRTGLRTLDTGQMVQTGHGVAAERASDTVDRLLLRKAEHVGGGNAKYGPDRIVDGQQIQTKYFKSGRACINDCFDNKRDGIFKYLDSTGKPMQVEVPKDKYDVALDQMERKIRDGKVPGIHDPNQAKDLVRQGWFTHDQAKNLVRFGTIESVSYDAFRGIQIAGLSFGISSVLSFAVALWQGKDVKDAALESATVGLRVGGITFVSTVAVSQLGRTGVEQSLRGATDATVQVLGPRVCAVIAQGMGKQGLRGAAALTHVSKLLRGNIVTGTVVTAVLSVADVYRLVGGRISFAQAFKNIATTGASVVGGLGGGALGATQGAALGATIGSIVPGLGTAIGGAIGGVVGFLGGGVAGGMLAGAATNKALGVIIEDDAIALSQEFQQVTSELMETFVLNEGEIELLTDKIQELDIAEIFREMYASDNARAVVASHVKPILVDLIASRPAVRLPTSQELLNSLETVLEQ